MSNVISLAAVRNSQQIVQTNNLPYHELSTRILTVAPAYVSPAATCLLSLIALYINEGSNELSYNFLCGKMRITTKTLSKYIDELEDNRLICVRRSRLSKRTNATNQFEIDFRGPLGGTMPKLKLPKNLNEKGMGKIPVPPSRVWEKVKGDSKPLNKENIVPKGTRRCAPTFDTIEEAIESSTKRIIRKRSEKAEKLNKPNVQLSFAAVKASWATAMLKHYPSVPAVAITVKEFAVFKARIAPLLCTANLNDIFDYFVGTWSTLRETKFKWLRAKGKDIALAPTLPELMRYWKVFAQAFADSRMVEANTAAKSVRSREDDLHDELAEARRLAAKAQGDAQKLAERLAIAERAARQAEKDSAPVLSLSERRKAADKRYNEDIAIPDWK